MLRLRRYRVFLLSAAAIVFVLYRVTKNTEQWEAVSGSLPYTGALPKSHPEHAYRVTDKAGAPAKSGTTFPYENDDLPQHIFENVGEDESAVKIPDLKPTEVTVDDFDLPITTTLLDIPHKNVQTTTTTPIHWQKMPENFPLAENDFIPLPTGKPNPIPAVQYKFEKEAATDRMAREERKETVKAAMRRSWSGYMTYARGHDELSPVTKKFRDPFCGWAATLVDSLDTLWIMDMKDEFEEALLEVEKIDFTVSNRSEIPVFETTIRYLGGLVAAYDVSGGKAGGYDILMEKAIELAEILMGVFDTPNRMPILYYNWKPALASQSKRAGANVGVAELGSLAMEFTRLAQITLENKYYDAVARITDAFFEWQERGTSITGIFPEHVDASGCNRTAEAAVESPTLGEEQKQKPLPECVSQGLSPAGWSEQYGMGGSQDSTYEYWPKQWLLLGGLEPKYKTLHLKTAEAVKKWLLYRPMVPDDRDILFSAKITTKGEPATDARSEFEVTHLTCFLGGMFGLGGKIFDVPADVEIGRKLTDGCVWAYENTPSGIMPEIAHVVPCADPDDCHWNQTMYEEWLDPLFDTRAAQIEDYKKHKAELKKQKAQEERENLVRQAAEAKVTKAGSHTDDEAEELRKASLDDEESGSAGEPVPKGGHGQRKSPGVQRRAPTSKIETLRDDAAGSDTVAGKRVKADLLKAAFDLDDDSDPAPSLTGLGGSQVPLREAEEDEAEDPARPLSHEEYVARRIKNEKLPPGFVDVNSKSYILRPEAIESVWYMYRITGDKYWQEKGWKMFTAIASQTSTEVGNSAIENVLITNSDKKNEMESFWTAETLKYFYLLYSDPSLISLDEWVLNTEAHPFKRPIAAFGV
ncbi:Uu.00g144920.m01.CDS01 [Anthostomella pinea]|uniref:alpha-1,2-Mannosidase n=1 Tax=Anthostomella pinea TaxID=933095 RepID=A0AAI8YJE6_9PEZI|nr:Uu.00g144920.m01.CDS01 [Anthostomella pinea]